MKLKWRNKPWWRDEEDGKLYIHPYLAFGSLAISIPLVWMALNAILGR